MTQPLDTNSEDDVPKSHHPSLWYSTGPMMKLWKKLLYVSILLLTLIVIRSVTDLNILVQAIQHHEPSLRIFRSLSEIALLLMCTSVSISIYTHYLTYNMTQHLLFQCVHDPSSIVVAIHDNENIHDDEYDRDGDGSKVDENQPFPLSEEDSDVNTDDEVTSLTSNVKGIIVDQSTSFDIPSPISILCMALDLFIWILMTFVLYLLSAIHAITLQQQSLLSTTATVSDNSSATNNIIRTNMARIAAPTFPLLLFLFCFVRVLQFKKVYSQLYTIISYTLHAPLYDITFRDGMIGDILTSMVRPMQDIAFTICYLLFGLRGWWSDHYIESSEITTELTTTSINDFVNNSTASILTHNIGPNNLGDSFLQAADARVPVMERSWVLHTAILPACMISPLWWRFLQTMRQSYDTKQRWPYLGNSFKYFFAAQVAMIGVYHPSMQHKPLWILSFVVATLYQIYWDVFMDWGLLVPGASCYTWRLRNQRLYPYKSFYWVLVIINTLLRFCWTLSFVPFHYLSAAGVLTSNFSSETWSNILIPTIASAEIIRRSLWGLLRVEWEAIKVRNDIGGHGSHIRLDKADEVEMTPMKVNGSTDSCISNDANIILLHRYGLPKFFTSDMSSMNEINIFGELCMYTTTFAVLGLIIAAHRATL